MVSLAMDGGTVMLQIFIIITIFQGYYQYEIYNLIKLTPGHNVKLAGFFWAKFKYSVENGN
jgi:hypothetical protein